MKIEIEIRRTTRGTRPGSLPWLIANIGCIKIGPSKSGHETAWLVDKEGKTITALACRNYQHGQENDNPTGEISLVQERPADEFHADAIADSVLVADRHFTAAAWKVIEEMARLAAEEMDRAVEEEDGDGEAVHVEVKRDRDRVAAELAGDALRDPAVVPILKARIKGEE